MKKPIPKICAACGEDDNLHAHHLVPRAVGGPPDLTIWLCSKHHGLVHGVEWKPNIRELSRRGKEKMAREFAEYKKKRELADQHAFEMGIPASRRTDGVLHVMEKLDEISYLLSHQLGPAAIHRKLGFGDSIHPTRFTNLINDYIYRPLGGWR